MDSNKIKNLATGAREALRAEVNARLDAVLAPDSAERLDNPNSIHLIEAAIGDRGRDHVVDQAAYTWFNRLCALRYMDARGYTPVPVVTPRKGSTQPAILADATQGVFDPEYQMSRLTRDRVSSLLMGTTPSDNATEAAYAQLISAVCAHYAEPMPYLFKEEVASSLLMPQGLLSENSILQRIVEDMDDNNCASVEVLGWLYQYYIAEKKDEIFASNKKRGADEIGPATQLFTPNWIVRYMAENSLGRIWMLNNPGSGLRDAMEYYIEGETPDEYLKVYSASELKVLDPACGSGHILVYCFDLLFAMYEEEGWQPEDIPAMILQNNLYGFEIDGRAGEIAKFALEMKAREKDPQFFDRHIDAMVTVLEPVRFSEGELNEAGLFADNAHLLEAFDHLDEIGSLYVPELSDEVFINNAIENLERTSGMFAERAVEKLNKMLEQVQELSQKFSAVVANPPYMTSKYFTPFLSNWLKRDYSNTRSDLCTCFIQRAYSFGLSRGYVSEITMQSWMFESSYEKLRKELLSNVHLDSLLHLGIKAFKDIGNDVVQTCAFTFFNATAPNQTRFIKLDDCKSYEGKQQEFHNDERYYCVDMQSIRKIPGEPFTAYWADKSILSAWENAACIEEYGDYTGSQNVTGNNDHYLRLHWEVSRQNISEDTWVPYAKGGNFRRYYGNIVHLVDWRDQARDYYVSNKSSNLLAPRYWFREGITYSAVTSRGTGFRYLPAGCVFDKGGASINIQTNLYEILALLNSKVAAVLFSVLNPSINLQVRDIKSLPIKLPKDASVGQQSKRLVEIAKEDWDEHEISIDFQKNPLCFRRNRSLQETLTDRQAQLQSRHSEALCLMREIDEEFANLYHIDLKLLPEYEERDIPTVDYNLKTQIKELISYGVGCLVGRYSLEKDGLLIADQNPPMQVQSTDASHDHFVFDDDGIIPILDGEWFPDDIATSFSQWLRLAFRSDSFKDNLELIETTLGCDLRSYFVKEFYEDHCKMFSVAGTGKRPFYWMFSSPNGSFSALVYLHRYTPSTVGRILTSYLREYIEKLNGAITALDLSDRAVDRRRADKYRVVVKELSDWERDVIYPLANERIEIDLDDGVKVNYNKFPHALRKVPGLSDWR